MSTRATAVVDVLISIYAIIRILIFDLPLFLLLANKSTLKHDTALSDQIQLFLIRRANELLPFKTIRWISDIGLPESILNSERYRLHRGNLFQEDSGPGFHGRWILKSSIEKSDLPKHSDIVILYLHGGGYFSSSISTYLLFLLRLAETFIRHGVSISIFALEYDLAPEAIFPAQLLQARAAYEWLQKHHQISPDKLLVMGDSAGGHLALSMLYSLQHPLEKSEQGVSLHPPGLGLVLISPWLSLTHQPLSFERNASTDVLSASFLKKTAQRFIGPDRSLSFASRSPYLEFLDPETGIDWKSVLPAWTWVSGGKREILYDDINSWVKARKAERGHEIQSELDQEESHVYSWLKTTDPGLRKRFLQRPFDSDTSSDDEFAAIERMGSVVLARINEMKRS